jgi:GT2 family glycosyltransferase
MMCSYNRLNLTKRMLDSFFKHTTLPYRFIVIDNGSTDGTVDFLNQTMKNNFRPDACQGMHFQFNEKNLGIAIGRNQGLKIANTYNDEWLSTLDNDIELPPHWLEDCIEIIQANRNFAIGINMEGTPYPLVTQNGKTFQIKHRGNLGTACTVFNRDLHNKIGFFNTDMGKYAHEDADYFFRARMVGYQLGYLKENGLHFGEGALDVGEYREFKTKCSKDNLVKFQQNCYAYMNKQKPIFQPYSE